MSNAKILHPQLYYMVYSHTLNAKVPQEIIHPGTNLLRAVPRINSGYRVPFGWVDNGPLNARQARCSSESPNRWTGPRPEKTGSNGVGGLYLSTHYNPLREEVLHYGRRDLADAARGRHRNTDELRGTRQHKILGRVESVDSQYIWITKRFFMFKVLSQLAVADVSLSSAKGLQFVHDLGKQDEIVAALDKAGYASAEQAYEANFDHSFDRAIGHAINDAKEYRGITVSSIREPSRSDNLVLLGRDRMPLPELRVTQEFVYYMDPHGNYASSTAIYDDNESVVEIAHVDD